MIKTLLLSSVFVFGFGVVSASAADTSDNPERRAVLKGRQIVWVPVNTEKPFALTGDAVQKKAEKAQRSQQPKGRAGYR